METEILDYLPVIEAERIPKGCLSVSQTVM